MTTTFTLKNISALFTLLTLGLSFNASYAVTLDYCHSAEKDAAGFTLCVETERRRAANNLRELSPVMMTEVNQQTQATHRKNRLREYRTMQAQHVRARAAQCRKSTVGSNRLACEADADFAHIERLQQFRIHSLKSAGIDPAAGSAAGTAAPATVMNSNANSTTNAAANISSGSSANPIIETSKPASIPLSPAVPKK